LTNGSLSDVRDTINVGEADVPDAKLQKMVKRAEVTLELELGREIDYNACTEAEKFGFGKGLAFLNQEGKALMVLTENGDLHLAGKIKKASAGEKS
jgi:hypothetical protein